MTTVADHEPITYREVVDYVAREMTELQSIRAESLLYIGRELEKLERTVDRYAEQLAGHEQWHRDVVQGLIDRGPARSTSAGLLILAALSWVTTIVVVLVTHAH